jgi:hypothetical protein
MASCNRSVVSSSGNHYGSSGGWGGRGMSPTPGKFTAGSRGGLSSSLEHCMTHFCSPVPQLSSADCPLGTFVVWAPNSSMWFLWWRFQLSQPRWGARLGSGARLGVNTTGSANLQTFLHIFGHFSPFRFGKEFCLSLPVWPGTGLYRALSFHKFVGTFEVTSAS